MDLSWIGLLHDAQVYNVDQLSGFLLWFVASNFELFEKIEQFQKLTGENLSRIKEHQRQQEKRTEMNNPHTPNS